jgi:hypothetical protein
MVGTETGEFTEKTLDHEGNAVRAFYAALETTKAFASAAHGTVIDHCVVSTFILLNRDRSQRV